MILRRMTEHVRAQNWLAVGIDFLIVVIGVFIGIEVSNFNSARVEAAKADGYLQRLHQDISDDIVMLQERQALWARQMQFGREALAASQVSPGEQVRAWEIIRAFHHASNSVPLNLRDATYVDMVSSGQLGLITDTNLRDLTTLYYNSSWAVDLSSLIPEYRVAVRRIIPPDIHSHLAISVCREFEAPHRHILKDCPAPDTEIDLFSLANTLTTDDELGGDLVYAMSVMNTSMAIVEGVIMVAAANLQARIEETLAGDAIGQVTSR